MHPVIQVQNRQRKLRIQTAQMNVFAQRALDDALSLGRNTSRLHSLQRIDVHIVSDRRIAALHRRFMNIEGPTDVITFQHGEIFISVETARRNARTFRTTVGRELRLYIIHGLLHLLGFDDKTADAAREMQAVQERMLERLAV